MKKSIEARDYIATNADIESVTEDLVTSGTIQITTRGLYLKMLVATTRAEPEIDAKPRQRNGKAEPLQPEEIEVHKAALEAVHARFYEIILAVARKGTKDPQELNARTNFARSSKATFLSWIRAGGDMRALAAGRVTKSALRVETAGNATGGANPELLQRATTRAVERLAESATAWAAQDKEKAVAAIETAMSRLAGMLTDLGVAATKNAAQAIRENRPFRSKEGGVFWPAARAGILEAAERSPLRAVS